MEVLRQLAAVALVFGLLAGALRVLRRRGLLPRAGFLRTRRAPPGRLEAIERLALSPQHTLHLVRVADRALLIGAHSGGCTLLESMPLGATAGRNAPEAT